MAPNPKHTEMKTVLDILLKEHLDALANSVFIPVTPQQAALDEARIRRIEFLRRKLLEIRE